MPYTRYAPTAGHEIIFSNKQKRRRDAMTALVRIAYSQPKKTLILDGIQYRREFVYLIESSRVCINVVT